METPPGKIAQKHSPLFTDTPGQDDENNIANKLAAASASAGLTAGAQEMQSQVEDNPEGNFGRRETEAITKFLVQCRIRNTDLSAVSAGRQKAIRIWMRDLLALVNGLDDKDVEVVLRQGSLVVDARISIRSGSNEPVLPGRRAVERVVHDTVGVDPVLDEPLVMREEEFWRTSIPATRSAATAQAQDGRPFGRHAPLAPSTPEFGLSSKPNFEAASEAARSTQDHREQLRAADQLKQPEVSPAMLEWSKEQEREGQSEDRGRQRHWSIVPERQINRPRCEGSD